MKSFITSGTGLGCSKLTTSFNSLQDIKISNILYAKHCLVVLKNISTFDFMNTRKLTELFTNIWFKLTML